MLTTGLLSLSNGPTAPSGERTLVRLNEERCESWEALLVEPLLGTRIKPSRTLPWWP